MSISSLVKVNRKGNDQIRFLLNGAVKGQINLHKFIDRDTKDFIFFCPSLDITGYGETENDAFEMIKASMDDFFEFLRNLSFQERDIKLRELGWEKSKFFNKRFSKAFVDASGELQNFNALDNKIETITVAA